MRKNGLISIYILEILEKYSCSRAKITQTDIIRYLDRDYNINVTRKTLSTYLQELREGGYITGKRGICKVNRLDDNELRLLIDGVLFGQHIPQKEAEQLISKLKQFSYKSLSNRVKHVCYLESMNHTQNNHLYKIIDTIDEAIEKNRRIDIVYCSYDTDGKLHNREAKTVDPYYMVTEKSRYYLICYAGRNNDVENRRLDRIANAKILNEPRTPITDLAKYSNGFNLGKYMQEHIYMFSGESVYARIKIKNKYIGDFIDWFGRDYKVVERAEDYIIVRIKVNENAVYYWALQYGDKAQVLAPEALRQRIIVGLKGILEWYGEERT